MFEEFVIHDSVGTPYTVRIDFRRKRALVIVRRYHKTFRDYSDKTVRRVEKKSHVMQLPFVRAMPGETSPNPIYDRRYEVLGNTVLLQLDHETYMYIGHRVFSFKTERGDVIQRYYSDLGKNDVPYPYAVGRTHVYIMLDAVCMRKDMFDMRRDCIYRVYADQYRVRPQRVRERTKRTNDCDVCPFRDLEQLHDPNSF